MTFDEAESYLYSLGNEVETMKLGLENITAMLAALGDPQNNYKKVQVAGTNGKGSVCAFLDSICREAGIRTGLYTSPHLISITERIKIDGVDIAEDEFARLATRVRQTAETLVADRKLSYTPTFFEQVTAIALLAFAERDVELAILETGLGGRYDAVTAAKAEVAAITRIDLDHQEYLGETIEEIAAEKAAIVRPESSVILLHQAREVERVLVGRCREVGIEPIWASTDVRIKYEENPTFGSITTERARYGEIDLQKMPGRHQFENAAIAVGIAELLTENGFSISHDKLVAGLNGARHPGRLELIQPNILLDGAHNPGGAKALRAYLDALEGRSVTMVFGAMREKAVSEIASILWPKADKLILTRPSNSRALAPDELAAAAPNSFPKEKIAKAETVEEAITMARSITPPGGLIIVTGSLYLVGEVRGLLNNK